MEMGTGMCFDASSVLEPSQVIVGGQLLFPPDVVPRTSTTQWCDLSLFQTLSLKFEQGRETILTSVTWDEGEFPVFAPVTGKISGPQLPERPHIKGDGYGTY